MNVTDIGRRSCLAFALLGLAGAPVRAQPTDEPPPARTAEHAFQQDRVVGPRIKAEIVGGILTGAVPGGSFRARLDGDLVHGAGPLGPIDVRVTPLHQGFDVAGVWNGGNIHFVFDGRTIRGSAVKQIVAGQSGVASCHYYIGPSWKSTTLSGREACMGFADAMQVDVDPQIATHLTTPGGVVMFVAYLTSPLPSRYR
jgi:hypothetical protein